MTKHSKPRAAEQGPFSHENWSGVLAAVDATYAELVAHQSLLEAQNTELDEHRRLMASVLGSVNDVMIILDREAVISEGSASLQKALGQDKPNYVGKSIERFLTQSSKPLFRKAWDGLRLAKEQGGFEAELLGDAGSVPVEFTLSARLNDRGRLIGAILLGRPLGELRRAYAKLEESHAALQQTQSQLVRNEKLAGLGRLLAGVAHELNNPISFVYANAHALGRYAHRFETYFEKVQEGATRAELIELRDTLKLQMALANLRTAIDGALEGSERVRDIVDDLRRLSSDGKMDAQDFDLGDVADVAARWVERGSKSGITPDVIIKDRVQVSGNPGHIQQIVMNLVQNAMDALKGHDGPKIELKIKRDGERAVLCVTDNGPGIPSAVAQSIFDPFFTTKPVGEGTGLGLAISHKIAEEHGGQLSLMPTESGTRLRLELPLREGAP